MALPELLDKEAERIRTLDALNSLEPHSSFDRIALLAQRVFDVPTALITLVDEDRIRFLAAIGMDLEDIEREVLLCNRVVASGKTLVVENTAAKSIYETQADHGIAFYAGAPLRTSDDVIVGTLCLLDGEPRSLDLPQRELLQHLADAAIEHILQQHQPEEKASTEQSEAEPPQWESFFRNSPVAMAIVGLDGNYVEFNPAFAASVHVNEAVLTTQKCWDWAPKKDRRWEASLFDALVRGKREEYQLERTIERDGQPANLHIQAYGYKGAAREVEQVIYLVRETEFEVQAGAGGDGHSLALMPVLPKPDHVERSRRNIEDMITTLEMMRTAMDDCSPEELEAFCKEIRYPLDALERPVKEMSLAFVSAFDARRPLCEHLNRHVARLELTSGLRVKTHFEHLPDALPRDMQENVLSIIKEGLDNVAQHAEVDEAILQLRINEGHVYVELTDEGAGFELSDGIGDGAAFGLMRMEDWALAAGGELRIDSTPGSGTTLIAEFNLDSA